ncbi:hypothetical protein, partial [Actinotalea ferrariae]|uniref:hypothetical protein n=1 Tax=Actinotalea ferrariae TaxID=1386098 RepID=UPI000558B232
MATSSQRRPLQPTSRLFHDVEVKVALGTLRCTFVGCSFTGLWDGNFSAGHGRHRVEGNDFRELRGADFRDGVDWSKNQFDHGGSQLILTAAAARSPVVRDVALTRPDLAPLC